MQHFSDLSGLSGKPKNLNSNFRQIKKANPQPLRNPKPWGEGYLFFFRYSSEKPGSETNQWLTANRRLNY